MKAVMKCEKCGGGEKVAKFEIRMVSTRKKYWKTLCRPCVSATIRQTKPDVADEILSFFEVFVWNSSLPCVPHMEPLDWVA